jgi:hypothetical protein
MQYQPAHKQAVMAATAAATASFTHSTHGAAQNKKKTFSSSLSCRLFGTK